MYVERHKKLHTKNVNKKYMQSLRLKALKIVFCKKKKL